MEDIAIMLWISGVLEAIQAFFIFLSIALTVVLGVTIDERVDYRKAHNLGICVLCFALFVAVIIPPKDVRNLYIASIALDDFSETEQYEIIRDEVGDIYYLLKKQLEDQ